MTDIIKTERFNLIHSGDDLIIFAYKDELQDAELNLNKIAAHTENTWERNRSQAETNKNTLQGKIVEELFIDLIHYENSKGTHSRVLSYITYDAIRQDSFHKHAPFDGLLFEQGNPQIDIAIARINQSIAANQYGYLDDATLDFCRKNKIYTFEIKSSKIPDRVYASSGHDPHKKSFQMNVISRLRQLDLFKYPKFNRKNGDIIHDAESYLNWVRENISSMRAKSDDEIIASEINSSLDIYTRVFIDDKLVSKTGRELFIGYLLGYVLGYEFYNNLNIMNFNSNKSQKAIYTTFPISQSQRFGDLFDDPRLWG
ncbi:hypothetical protein ABEH87_15030 [Erwinia sp. Eh17-17]|uniref:hypothetical protein n=1 Tax=Erwinia sp. Eh17-17 TaxID=3080330 RepID=UPI0032081FA6